MPGHRKPKQLSSTVAYDQKGKQALERQGGNHAQIDRRRSFVSATLIAGAPTPMSGEDEF
jgi:hypothetical protein